MKVLFFLYLLFASTLSSVELVEIDPEVLSALKTLEGTKIQLPKELVKILKLQADSIDKSGIGITAEVDGYVDRVLGLIQKFIIKSGFDPVELPDATLKLIPTGTISLSTGWLQDTSTIQRNGNATINYSSSTRRLELNLPIKFSALLVTYQYVTKVLLLKIKGDANGKIEDLIINIKLSYDYKTYQASLDTFEIKDSGRFSLKFTGNGLVDWITNTMTTVATLFLQPIVIRIIQSMIKGGLESVVDNVNDIINSIFNP